MTKIKRFVVFAFGNYYPAGGLFDFHSCWDTLQEAKDAINKIREKYDPDYIQIWDKESIDVWYWDYHDSEWKTAMLPFKFPGTRQYN